jgi:hypothetical protein
MITRLSATTLARLIRALSPAVPVGRSARTGLPVGVQVVGGPGSESNSAGGGDGHSVGADAGVERASALAHQPDAALTVGIGEPLLQC